MISGLARIFSQLAHNWPSTLFPNQGTTKWATEEQKEAWQDWKWGKLMSTLKKLIQKTGDNSEQQHNQESMQTMWNRLNLKTEPVVVVESSRHWDVPRHWKSTWKRQNMPFSVARLFSPATIFKARLERWGCGRNQETKAPTHSMWLKNPSPSHSCTRTTHNTLYKAGHNKKGSQGTEEKQCQQD